MPMIDIYATDGLIADGQALAQAAARTVMEVEQVPPISMFKKNTAGFFHAMPPGAISNVDGDSNYVRVQVLTNSGALDREKQLTLVDRLSKLVAEHAGDPTLAERTWVLLTEATPGGWGLWGKAQTNEDLVTAARAELAKLKG